MPGKLIIIGEGFDQKEPRYTGRSLVELMTAFEDLRTKYGETMPRNPRELIACIATGTAERLLAAAELLALEEDCREFMHAPDIVFDQARDRIEKKS